MRVVLATHAPLSGEFGAAQIVMNFGAALQRCGAEVAFWSPPPLEHRSWRRVAALRSALAGFLRETGPYDIVDAYPGLISRRIRHDCRLIVARSVQPDLLYLVSRLRASRLTRLPSAFVSCLCEAVAAIRGYHTAAIIYCLGTAEGELMSRAVPWLRHKLRVYFAAPDGGTRPALAAVRAARTASSMTRYLWIGRWSEHKGTRLLVRFIDSRLRAGGSDTFTIAGCGPAAVKGIPPVWIESGRVRIIPAFTRDELPALLATHDAGLFTSIYEGWGLVLNEMLESGLPVFATRAGGVTDLRPHFSSLHDFPPPPFTQSEPVSIVPGYFSMFSWDTAARDYLSHVGLALQGGGLGTPVSTALVE